jgi:hypothetical protein
VADQVQETNVAFPDRSKYLRSDWIFKFSSALLSVTARKPRCSFRGGV